MTDVAQLEVQISTDRALSNLRTLKTSVSDFGSSFDRMARASMGVLDDLAEKAKYAALVFGGISIAGVKMASELERDMMNVATLMDNVTERQLKGMTREVQNIAIQFNQTAKDATKALFDITSSGFMGADAMRILHESARLAVAGVTDIKNTSNLLTSAINAYALTAQDATRVSDIFFAGQVKGKMTIEEMAQAMGRVLPAAKTAGVSLEDLTASIATMTISGLNTNQAVTAMNGMLLAMVNPSNEAVKAINRLGLEFKNANGQTIPLIEAFKQLKGFNLETLGQIIPDREALVGVASIVNNMGKLEEIMRAMPESAGATEKAFNKMAETGSFKLGQLGSTLKKTLTDWGTAIMESDAFKIGLDKILKSLSGFSVDFQSHSQAMKVSINEFTIAMLTGLSRVTEALGFFVENVSKGVGAISFLAAGAVELSRITLDSLSVEKTKQIALVGEQIAQVREQALKLNINPAGNDGNWLQERFKFLSETLRGFIGELGEYETLKAKHEAGQEYLFGLTDKSFEYAEKAKGAFGKINDALLEYQSALKKANEETRKSVSLGGGGGVGSEIQTPKEAPMPGQANFIGPLFQKEGLASNWAQIQQFTDELNRFYGESQNRLSQVLNDREKAISAEYEAELTKLAEFHRNFRDLNVKNENDRVAIQQKLEESLNVAYETAQKKRELMSMETNQKISNGIYAAYSGQYEVSQQFLNREVEGLRKSGADEVDLETYKTAKLMELRRNLYQSASDEQEKAEKELVRSQLNSQKSRLSDEKVFYADRLRLAQESRQRTLESDRVSDEEKRLRLMDLNREEERLRFEQLARYQGSINEKMALEAQYRQFVISNGVAMTEEQNRNINVQVQANTDALLKQADDQRLTYQERASLLGSLRDRNLDMIQAVSLAEKAYLNEARPRWAELSDYLVGSFRAAESGISKMFFDPVSKKFFEFKDGLSGIFDTIRDAFFKMLADMAARIAMSGLLNLGARILGFSGGGIIPESGLFAGQTGEAVLTRNAVGLLGTETIKALNTGSWSAIGGVEGVGGLTREQLTQMGITETAGTFAPTSTIENVGSSIAGLYRSGAEWFKSTFPGFSESFAGLGGAVGGIGASFLNNALFGSSTGVSFGGTLGSAAGGLAAAALVSGPFAPLAIALGSFGGGVLGGFFGSLFGGGPTPSEIAEGEFQSLYPKALEATKDVDSALALAMLAIKGASPAGINDAVAGLGLGFSSGEAIYGHRTVGLMRLLDKQMMTVEEMDKIFAQKRGLHGHIADDPVVLDFIKFLHGKGVTADILAGYPRAEDILDKGPVIKYFGIPYTMTDGLPARFSGGRMFEEYSGPYYSGKLDPNTAPVWVGEPNRFASGLAREPVDYVIPKFANGGVVNRATLGLIGEAGPEAVIPLKNGSVPVNMNNSAVVKLLSQILQALGQNENKSEIVLNLDGNKIGEALLRRSRNGIPIINAKGVEGLVN